MKFVVALVFLSTLVVVLGLPQRQWVHICDKSYCSLPNCQCSETSWSETTEKPQFVILSFDDAVSESSFNEFIRPTFVGRKNPDGCPISGTFFVPHEYSNYSVVNQLYNLGFEIGSHSITKNYSQDYWRFASSSLLSSEFSGQRTILSTFANISSSVITGVRVPQLQLNNNTFRALLNSSFLYDASWPTQQPWTFYPYTLDYTSRQQCHTIACQVESTPGLWEMPIVDWMDDKNVSCNSIQACAVEKEIRNWMIGQFEQLRKHGAPISLRVSYSWFLAKEEHQEALNEFLDYLQRQDNTFIVSYKQVLQWSRNPRTEFSSCQSIARRACQVHNCSYRNRGSKTLERNTAVCGRCPTNYPWLNNPLGQYPNHINL